MNRRPAPGDAAPPRVRALWTDLAARLWLVQVACREEQARRQLRALGLRRTATAGTILCREGAHVRRMAALAGVTIDERELHRRIGALARPSPLVDQLHDLVGAYRRILLEGAMPDEGPLTAWLESRQRVHLAQAAAVASLGQPRSD